MGAISEKDKKHLQKIFEKNVQTGVKILVFTQEDRHKEIKELMQELATTSNKIEVELYDFTRDSEKIKQYNIDKIPAIAIIGKEDYGVRFYGIPSGYEFSSLVEDIIDVSRGTTDLPEKIRNQLGSINKPIHIQVFVTPTCPYCPKVVRLAHKFAIENDLIISDMIEATEFPNLALKYRVMSVPKTVINEKIEFVGALSEEDFLEYILAA